MTSRRGTFGGIREFGLVLAEDSPPYRGIEIAGRARLSEDIGPSLVTRLAVRYLGAERGNAWARVAAKEALLLIRIEPGRLRVWDFADEF
jgi:hypothetical protein